MELTGQWADSLLSAERLHLTKLAVWGLASIVAGSALLAFVRVRALESPLLRQFGIQMASWGALVALVAAWGHGTLALRDLAGAVSLDRMVWFSVGLAAGVLGIGATLVLVGWRVSRRPGIVGAGLAVATHGAALALLGLQLAAHIVR